MSWPNFTLLLFVAVLVEVVCNVELVVGIELGDFVDNLLEMAPKLCTDDDCLSLSNSSNVVNGSGSLNFIFA